MHFRVRRSVLPPQSQVQRQLRVHLPVVLRIRAVQRLQQMRLEERRQRVVVGGSKQEVRPIRIRRRRGVGACRSRTRRASAVSLPISKGAKQRVRVLHFHPHMLVLVAKLERVPPLHPRKIDLGVQQRWILPLRIGALPAECAKASRDARRRQSARHRLIRRQPRNHNVVLANRQRVFARPRSRKPHARINYLVRAHQVRVTQRYLLIQNLDPPVRLSVQRPRQRAVVDARFLAVAHAHEPRALLALLIVEPQIALVRVIGKRRIGRAVVACPRPSSG